MKTIFVSLTVALCTAVAQGAVRSWTNTLGGNWFVPANWSPNAVPGSIDVANITNSGTYTITIATGAVAIATLNLGAPSGAQTIIQGTTGSFGITNQGTVSANGILIMTNGSLQGRLSVLPGGQFQLAGASTKGLYQLTLINQGTITWSDGALQSGSTPATIVSNGGLWEITGNNIFNSPFAGPPTMWTNGGTVRKSAGTGISQIDDFQFINLPSGLVETLSGTLQFGGNGTNSRLAGSWVATSPGLMNINSGIWFDAGGTTSGTGTNRFHGGTLNLRTNTIPGLRHTGGDIFITGTTTFQQAGAITNLTLDGSALRGTNRVGTGTMTMNSGRIGEQLTVQSGGQLQLLTSATKALYQLTLLNQGTITWADGTLQSGSTPTTVVSNGGLWEITGNNIFNNPFGGPPTVWTNSGTLRKSAGAGTSQIDEFQFINTSSGLVESLSGILQFGGSGTNSRLGGSWVATSPGIMTLNSGIWYDAGGIASGTGTNRFHGGTLNLQTNIIPGLRHTGGDIFITGTTTFQQAGAITNLTLDGSALRGTNRIGTGALTMNSGRIGEQLTVQPGGQLQLLTSSTKALYQLTLLNQGTVSWVDGTLQSGSTPTTIVSNGGLWEITGNNVFNNPFGGPPTVWTNSGTLRKSAGTGTSQIDEFQFINLPSGLVETLTGTLQFGGSGTNSRLGGSWIATSPGLMNINSGIWFDAGGIASGTGTNRFNGGTLNLRTNTIPGLRHTGGDIFITGTTTFQQAGAITNLTLDGSALRGTNRVGNGALTMNSGRIGEQLTVQSGGQLQLLTSSTKALYQLTLLNQGTVSWVDGTLQSGSTPTTIVSNGGLWEITGNNVFNNPFGGPPTMWNNSGILRKSAGAGVSQIDEFQFINLPSGLVETLSGTLQFGGSGTNSRLGGSWAATSPGLMNINAGIWFDAGGTASGTGTNRFNGGTLNLRTNIIPGLRHTGGDIFITGTTTFQQAGAITNLTLDGSALRGTNQVGTGALTMNSGRIGEQLTVQPGGQLQLLTSATKALYQLTLLNQGTVSWADGTLQSGSTPATIVSNGGLWEITGNNVFNNPFGGPPTVWTNSGTLRKSAGTGTSQIDEFQFINLPSGLVETLSGTLQFGGSGTNSRLGGSWVATSPGLMSINFGTWYDAGGATSGTGTNRFNGGTLNLRTNTIPGLRHTGGDIFITGTTTFQQAGAITNLTLDGSALRGTNRVGIGALTMNAGRIGEQLTVQPGGQLQLLTSATKALYQLTLLNQGTVTWADGTLQSGSTPTTIVSNGGLWEITGNNILNNPFGGPPTMWTNSGTLRKSAGAGISQIDEFQFINTSSGLVQADTGTLQLPLNYTNTAGTLRLNGGTLQASGTLGMNGGTLEGAGSLGVNSLAGGLISPGQSGPGLIGFKSGLNLGAGATLTMSGTGLVPGSQYDQLSVTGAVALASATLQVPSLPSVAAGTTFVLIQNDGADPVSGTFNSLAENALVSVSGQPFRIHYIGGSGNDVTLVRESGAGAPQLSNGGYTNGTFRLVGGGGGPLVYTVQATTNFLQWTTIGTVTGDGGGNFSFIDSNALLFKYRFYRTTN